MLPDTLGTVVFHHSYLLQGYAKVALAGEKLLVRRKANS
jgi:hypothetical protein